MQQEFKNKILNGDALTILKTLPSESVDCIITSPPYWALRDYKVDGQIGNEKTIDEYINNLTQIFNECKRILKREGTCWVVLGDTYSGSGYGVKDTGKHGYNADEVFANGKDKPRDDSTPSKSLCLIPERFALKMIENKWILRNKIIWFKPNCIPSSAKDRYTVDFENVYFFTKSPRYYFKTQYEKALDSQERWNGGFIKVPKRSKGGECAINFTVFPPELVKQCLDAGCTPNGLTLDPFMGSGTVALVALKNAKNFVGIELNPEYITMAMKRIEPYLKQEKLTQFTR
jgi:site-specific DNA-methyltransferase (adenine-specific)